MGLGLKAFVSCACDGCLHLVGLIFERPTNPLLDLDGICLQLNKFHQDSYLSVTGVDVTYSVLTFEVKSVANIRLLSNTFDKWLNWIRRFALCWSNMAFGSSLCLGDRHSGTCSARLACALCSTWLSSCNSTSVGFEPSDFCIQINPPPFVTSFTNNYATYKFIDITVSVFTEKKTSLTSESCNCVI